MFDTATRLITRLNRRWPLAINRCGNTQLLTPSASRVFQNPSIIICALGGIKIGVLPMSTELWRAFAIGFTRCEINTHLSSTAAGNINHLLAALTVWANTNLNNLNCF
jgi:hypothetical protein